MAASEQGWKTDLTKPDYDAGFYWGGGGSMEHAHRENPKMEAGGQPLVMTIGS